jgi:hypothetical protein
MAVDEPPMQRLIDIGGAQPLRIIAWERVRS